MMRIPLIFILLLIIQFAKGQNSNSTYKNRLDGFYQTTPGIGAFNFYSENHKALVLLSIGNCTIQDLPGQDTVRYIGVLSNGLIYESFELYPDFTFKWENEYDLSWKEFGLYEKKGNKLTLTHFIKFYNPITMTVADSIAIIGTAFRISNYEISGDKLYKLNDQNKRVRKIKETSLRKKWSWLFGNRYKLLFKKQLGAIYIASIKNYTPCI
jgi:hypothetical protein